MRAWKTVNSLRWPGIYPGSRANERRREYEAAFTVLVFLGGGGGGGARHLRLAAHVWTVSPTRKGRHSGR